MKERRLERSDGLVRSTGRQSRSAKRDWAGLDLKETLFQVFSSLFKNRSLNGARLNLYRVETAAWMSAAPQIVGVARID